MRILLALISCSFLVSCGFEVVDTGNRGVKVVLGKVTGEALPEGLYFYNPLTSDIKEISVREEKFEQETEAFTKDTQVVKINFAMTYYPNPAGIQKMYEQFGDEWTEKIIKPAVLGSLKDVIGQYVADDLVSKREVARDAAFAELKKTLETRNVYVTRLDLTNLDFDDAYEKAVEEKVVAIQQAAKAKNTTVQIEEQAKQTVIGATAAAESMKIRSQALSQNQNLVEYEAVQKWDGKLPQYMMGSSTPFINLGAGK